MRNFVINSYVDLSIIIIETRDCVYLNRPIEKENPVFSFDFTQPPDVWVHPNPISLAASESVVSLRCCFFVEDSLDDSDECS